MCGCRADIESIRSVVKGLEDSNNGYKATFEERLITASELKNFTTNTLKYLYGIFNCGSSTTAQFTMFDGTTFDVISNSQIVILMKNIAVTGDNITFRGYEITLVSK